MTGEEEEEGSRGEGAAAASLGFGRAPSFFFGKYLFFIYLFCRVFGNGLLQVFSPSSGLPFLHTLRSVFIVQESHCLREVKSQSNSFSFLKFELESNSKTDNYHYLEGKDYLEDKDRMTKAHCSP